jgi:predicted ATPase
MQTDKLRSPRRLILTGAPGTGKSTVIKLLRSRGYSCIDEPAREIIAEQRAINGDGIWERDTRLFIELLLSRSLKNYSLAAEDLTIFDRAIPDCIAYAHLAGLSLPHGVAASMQFRYEEDVVLFPPWEEIYCTDDERTMTFEAVCQFHEVLVQVYQEVGYRVTEVAKCGLEERVEWIMGKFPREDLNRQDLSLLAGDWGGKG